MCLYMYGNVYVCVCVRVVVCRALLTDFEDDKYTVNGEEDFIPSPKFTGDKAGMIHKNGRKGMGYYKDPHDF